MITYVVRRPNIRLADNFRRAGICRRHRMNIGRVIRAMLIRMFMASMAFPQAI